MTLAQEKSLCLSLSVLLSLSPFHFRPRTNSECIYFVDTAQESMSSSSLVSIMTESRCSSTVDVGGCTAEIDKHYLPCQVATPACDACPCCADTCGLPFCGTCTRKSMRPIPTHVVQCRDDANWLLGALTSFCPTTASALDTNSPQTNSYTMCQLRRHNSADSAWILVGDTIYDATPYLRNHPGGTTTILKKSGGVVDCTEDLSFHSKRAQKEWRKYKVGTLRQCSRSS